MKSFFTLILVSLLMTAAAQNGVKLRFEHTMGGESLEFMQSYAHPDLGYDFNITRLEYYVSEIAIVHDGGQTTPVADTWLLVDAAEQEDFDLGQHSITDVEAITFHVGVDPEHNHLDPTLWPANHPLAPQNPSMHWGWTAGYRFVCLEGKTGPGLLFIYQVHALGDANYWQASVPTAAIWEGDDLVIILNADYLGMLTDIDVSGGLIEHGETGAASTLLKNFSNEVYSQILFTGLGEQGQSEGMAVYPNPTFNGSARVSLDPVDSRAYRLVVTDVSGRTLSQQDVIGHQPVGLDLPQRGMYFVQLLADGKLVRTEKLIVAQ